MEDELQIAREIQKNLLPSQLPTIPGFEISGKNISCYEVGGDYYDCIKLNDYLFAIAIAALTVMSPKSPEEICTTSTLYVSCISFVIDFFMMVRRFIK